MLTMPIVAKVLDKIHKSIVLLPLFGGLASSSIGRHLLALLTPRRGAQIIISAVYPRQEMIIERSRNQLTGRALGSI